MDPNTQCLIVSYIGCQSSVDSLQQDVESISELDFKGANTLMGFNSLHYELIYLVGMNHEGWICSRFTFVYKGVLVIT